jgi:hypothetical protein
MLEQNTYQGSFAGEETSVRNYGKKEEGRMAPHPQLAGQPLKKKVAKRASCCHFL